MKRTQTSKARFVQYLTGLAVAAAPCLPASADTLAAPTGSTKVSFADNLTAKMAVATPIVRRPGPGPYTQTFGDLYVQTTFVEVQPHATGEGAAMPPSEAFKLITGW